MLFFKPGQSCLVYDIVAAVEYCDSGVSRGFPKERREISVEKVSDGGFQVWRDPGFFDEILNVFFANPVLFFGDDVECI